MDIKSTVRAFQTILSNHQFSKAGCYPEEFAISRFYKKMEVPSKEGADRRRSECWERWLDTDRRLPIIRLPSSEWYKARILLHSWLQAWRLSPVEFTSGSEFTPTKGRNSLEAKLCASEWTCTHDNFEHFARLCYGHKALKRAVRRRFAAYIRKKGWTERGYNRWLYERYRTSGNISYSCFRAKVYLLTTFTHGSRFSTVPKNNEKDRPINIEPFANILLQKQVGGGFRDVLKNATGIELDSLATIHRIRIADVGIATIDLSDASDSISMSLCEFLLPRRILKWVKSTRSEFILGLDKDYHLVNKVSSMGNGFTFELMTLILTAICRTLDTNATVFGDDIVITKDKASRLIDLLTEVGWKVNIDKSFTEGDFRESCGANWHAKYGYIRSYDFVYPENIHDCVVIYNKCVALSRDPAYKAFSELEKRLRRTIPTALRGTWGIHDDELLRQEFTVNFTSVAGRSPLLDGYFRVPIDTGGFERVVSPKRFAAFKAANQKRNITSMFFGFTFVPELRTPFTKRLRNGQWAKYEMYLHAGRAQKDVVKKSGRWVRKLLVSFDGEAPIVAKPLMDL